MLEKYLKDTVVREDNTTDIKWDLNTKENWVINAILSRKLKYLDTDND